MTELSMQTSLVYSAILTLVMILTAGVGKGRYWTMGGLMYGAGNRDNPPPQEPWVGRADRAANNMMESMLLFVALIAAAQGMGISNEATTLGATLFFWARLAYFPIYVIGIPWLRTGVWGVAIAGMVIITLELI
ncbi:MAG: MAPEG family protein [Rhodospirillales bacterium]|nr:MAPEG family protein [Rhodospirillales bacterium]